MRRMLLLTSCLATLALAQKKSQPEPGTWLLEGEGRNEKHVCAQNEEIEVEGRANTLKLTGPCKSLRIVGSKNTVAIETTNDISIKGEHNTVSWQSSARGQPRLHTHGEGNTITQYVDPKKPPRK